VDCGKQAADGRLAYSAAGFWAPSIGFVALFFIKIKVIEGITVI